MCVHVCVLVFVCVHVCVLVFVCVHVCVLVFVCVVCMYSCPSVYLGIDIHAIKWTRHSPPQLDSGMKLGLMHMQIE